MANFKQLSRTESGNFDFSRIREAYPDLAGESDLAGEPGKSDERSFCFSEHAKQNEELRSLQVPDAERLVAGLEGQALMSLGGIGPSSRPSGWRGFHRDISAGRVPRVVGTSGAGFDRHLLDEQRSAEIRAEVMNNLRAAPRWYTEFDLRQLCAFAQVLKQAGYGGQPRADLVGRASESIGLVRQGNHPELLSSAQVTAIGYDVGADQVQVRFSRS
jgi:hypothetical protein